MEELELVELDESGFNHFVHHYGECDVEHPHFNEALGCLEVEAECVEEYEWSALVC